MKPDGNCGALMSSHQDVGLTWGCICPSARSSAIAGPSSSQALPCLSRAVRAGQGLSLHGQGCVWGWERVRVSKRGGGGVGTATAWSVQALEDLQYPAEVPVLALDQALMDPSCMLLTCNTLGMSAGPAKGCAHPDTSCPGRGPHVPRLGDRAVSFTWATGPALPRTAPCPADILTVPHQDLRWMRLTQAGEEEECPAQT